MRVYVCVRACINHIASLGVYIATLCYFRSSLKNGIFDDQSRQQISTEFWCFFHLISHITWLNYKNKIIKNHCFLVKDRSYRRIQSNEINPSN